MAEGTKLADAYVQIIPSAKGIKGKITQELGGEADNAGKSAGLSIATAIKGAIAAAGIGVALKASISEGANLQQSLGGIETLFKDSADKVIANAKNAYKTAGMSANDYMETVTSFSASLLQGLAGDTNKAADVADMALTDMSDNANKMGTSMELIQNAYQGFAKQNYTMLDNLKLGYGGTKTEMQRLLADAQKLTGVKYDISNLSDVYEAIHVVQEEMDITGTTAKEAASTFSGSLASMKAAFSNVLGNLALGEDIKTAMEGLIQSVRIFLVDNLAPMIKNILSTLPDVIKGVGSMIVRTLAYTDYGAILEWALYLIRDIANSIIGELPYLAETAVNIAQGVGEVLMNWEWQSFVVGMLKNLKSVLLASIGECFGSEYDAYIEGIFGFLINGANVLFEGITTAFTLLWETCNTIWTEVGQPILDMLIVTFQFVADNWGSISAGIQETFQFLWDAFSVIWENVGRPIFDTLVGVFQYIADNWNTVLGGIQEAFQILWDVVNTIWTEVGVPIFDSIENILGIVKDAFAERMPAIQEFVGSCFSDIKIFWENNLKPCLQAIGSFIENVLAPVFEAVFKGYIGPLIDTVFTTIKNLWNHTLKPVFTGITDFLTGIFTLNFKKAFEGLKSFMDGIINGIITGIETFINSCIGAINGLIGSINNLIGKAGDLIGIDLHIPEYPYISIPKLAKGGILEKGQVGLLEGSGAEAVVPLENNARWIARVASDLNAASGNNDILQEILDVLISMRDDMPEEFAAVMSRMKFVLNEREFGRLVRAVN